MWCPSRVNIGFSVFSLYVNDLPTHTNFNVNLFAYDTVLTMKDKSLSKLQATVNCELAIVDDWMKLNRLSLNYSKSTYFIVKPFSYNSKNIALDDFNVSIGQHKINSTIYTKYLGILRKHRQGVGTRTLDCMVLWTTNDIHTMMRNSFLSVFFFIKRTPKGASALLRLTACSFGRLSPQKIH